jgi:RNA polymerase sigma-70 factor (ECF subfamily)
MNRPLVVIRGDQRRDAPGSAPERGAATAERSRGLSALSDDELVRQVQRGDRAAFDELYARNVDRIHAVCLRMCGSRTMAEQLTQDSFVRAWQKLGSFRGDSAFSSWLHRLTVNVVLENGRREQRRSAYFLEVEDGRKREAAAPAVTPDERFDLERAIAALPRGARAVLVLYDIEGYPQEEIAAMLGIAIGTVKAQLHRARRLLREALG